MAMSESLLSLEFDGRTRRFLKNLIQTRGDNVFSLKEQAKRIILRTVRSKGHSYIELRENGKKFIFFCTLCLAPCYGDNALFDHLKGRLHTTRLVAARVTLLGPNPWPFNDGMAFFHNPDDNKSRMLESLDNDNSLAIVEYGDNLNSNYRDHSTANGVDSAVVIPGVLVRDEITDIQVTRMGCGEIAARFLGNDDKVSNGIGRIWCEWLGQGVDSDDCQIPEHDFAVVTFSYNINLGRDGLLNELSTLLSSAVESETGQGSSCKRKKSGSDTEDNNDTPRNHCDSFGEDSSAICGPGSRSLVDDHYDDRLLDTRLISNKSARRQLRQQQILLSGRECDICQQRMLPGKDVATLMNVKTGKLACSSRNVNGIFHVFHTSCLIHWLLLCEVENITNQCTGTGSKVRRTSRRKAVAKSNEKNVHLESASPQTYPVFCPECQGTGVVIDGNDVEKPKTTISQIFKYKIKLSDARRAWMESPEVLENCSIGFHFPSQFEEGIQEKVKKLKLLHFYKAYN